MEADLSVLEQRLEHLVTALVSEANATATMSDSTKGSDREWLVTDFLRRMMPTSCRLSSGDVVDSYGHSSGQLDIVVESDLSISFPSSSDRNRLYIAEGVAAVVEVKSDLRKQWPQVEAKADKVKVIRRRTPSSVREAHARFFEMLSGIPTDLGSAMATEAEYHRERLADTPYRRADLPLHLVGLNGWATPKPLGQRAMAVDADSVVVLCPLQGFFRKTIYKEDGSIHRDAYVRHRSGPSVILELVDQIAQDWRMNVGALAQDLTPYIDGLGDTLEQLTSRSTLD